MAGAVRFGLFIVVIALAAISFYANSLTNTIEQQRSSITSLEAERDTLKIKVGESEKQASDNAAALKNAETKMKMLQAELEEAKKPAARGGRK